MASSSPRKRAAAEEPTIEAHSVGKYKYMAGFGAYCTSEAPPHALPAFQNTPQVCPYGLYAEQLSGSPFTAPRAANERSWLYRIRPTVKHFGRFEKMDAGTWKSAPCREVDTPIAPLRWDPLPMPTEALDFLDSVRTFTTAGDCEAQAGMAAHIFTATASMRDRVFYNADAEMLFIPQSGGLRFVTEMGILEVEPGEIAVIPRGVKHRVELTGGPVRGYLCENYGGKFTLPERGPIGANCLANQRDFLVPVAWYEDREVETELVVKWGGDLWRTTLPWSPLDVVAWHGNYAPYKYDLRRFSPVGPLLYDHADPSIFTVLTSPSETAGTANIDFVIFPERWMVAENTFRPPWYHRNVDFDEIAFFHGGSLYGQPMPPGLISHAPQGVHHGAPERARERARRKFHDYHTIDWKVIAIDTRQRLVPSPMVLAADLDQHQ